MIGVEDTIAQTQGSDWEGLLFVTVTSLVTLGIEYIRRWVMAYTPKKNRIDKDDEEE